MPILITDPRQSDNPIVFVNDAFLQLTGYDRQEVLGRNCRFLQGNGTNVHDIRKVREAIAQRERLEIDLLNYRKDGTSFWNRLFISPVFDAQGEPSYFIASQFDVTPGRSPFAEHAYSKEQLHLQIENRIHELSESENRLQFVLNAAQFGSWTLDVASKRLALSSQAKANFGRGAADSFNFRDAIKAMEPADRKVWQSALSESDNKNRTLHIEYRIRTPNGETRWLEAHGRFSASPDGDLTLTGISQDITERKEAEERRRVLARELNHRVKNSLAIAQSIFARSLESSETFDEARELAFGRISAMSKAQDLLATDDWNSARIRPLIEEVLAPFDGAKIKFSGPDVVLNEQAVSTLSLALYELATNATKYGAMSTSEGIITVEWEVVNSDEPSLRLVWAESGGPAVHTPTRRGFGSKIIENVLSATLNADAHINYEPGGVRFEMMAPINSVDFGGGGQA